MCMLVCGDSVCICLLVHHMRMYVRVCVCDGGGGGREQGETRARKISSKTRMKAEKGTPQLGMI